MRSANGTRNIRGEDESESSESGDAIDFLQTDLEIANGSVLAEEVDDFDDDTGDGKDDEDDDEEDAEMVDEDGDDPPECLLISSAMTDSCN